MGLKRKITSELLRWKADVNKVGLLIKGARQVGKTYSVDEFGKNEYEHYLKLDMHDERNRAVFSNISADNIVRRISILNPRFKIEKGRSLLFIDEIQLCPDAILAIKYLVTETEMDVIASGSMLGIDRNPPRSYPVGYVREICMYPLDFEEYLWAIGMSEETTSDIRAHVRDTIPFDPLILRTINEYFRQHLIIGGLPKVVSSSISTSTYAEAMDSLDAYISSCREDVYAYADRNVQNDVRKLFEIIPAELSRANKRLRFGDIDGKSNVGIREYREPVDWLKGACIVNLCYRIRSIERPLKMHIKESMFKMYLLDTGVLIRMLGQSTMEAIADDDISVNEGAIAENAVCSMLSKCGIEPYYYEIPKELEIDFVVELGKDLCAIEVKSGRKRKARSLKKLMDMEQGRNVSRWIKFEYGNIMLTEDGVEHYPLFAVAFIDSISRHSQLELKSYESRDGSSFRDSSVEALRTIIHRTSYGVTMEKFEELMTKHREAISYVFWGAFTTLISLGTYAVFVKVGINSSISNILSWFCGVAFAFVTNKLYVFRSVSLEKHTVVREFGLFMSSRIFTGAIAWILFPLLLMIGIDQSFLGFENMWTKIITSLVEIALNWALSKYLVFSRGQKESQNGE